MLLEGVCIMKYDGSDMTEQKQMCLTRKKIPAYIALKYTYNHIKSVHISLHLGKK